MSGGEAAAKRWAHCPRSGRSWGWEEVGRTWGVDGCVARGVGLVGGPPLLEVGGAFVSRGAGGFFTSCCFVAL